jgi:hypothetical protein
MSTTKTEGRAEQIRAMPRADIRLAIRRNDVLMHGSCSWRYDISYQAIRKRAHAPDGRASLIMRFGAAGRNDNCQRADHHAAFDKCGGGSKASSGLWLADLSGMMPTPASLVIAAYSCA